MTKEEQEKLDAALRVVRAAEDSGSYGQECAADFKEKYPEEFTDDKYSQDGDEEDYNDDDD